MEASFFSVWRLMKGMFEKLAERAPYLIVALLVFGFSIFVGHLLRKMIRRFALRRVPYRNLAFVLGRLIQWSMVFLGLMVALVIVLPNFTPARLVELLGIGGIAVGFAFKDILQNFLAGILLLLTRPFRIGDQIVVGNYEGDVEDIQTRATLIKTYDGRRVVIPNTELFTTSVTVNTAFALRRLEYDFGVGYGDDLKEVKRVALQTIRSCEGVLDDPPPDILVVGFAESGVQVRIRWWIQPPRRQNALDQRDQILNDVKNALHEHGIDIPFPTRQILFHDQTEEVDGDRSRQREGWPRGIGSTPKPRNLLGAFKPLRVQKADETGGRSHE